MGTKSDLKFLEKFAKPRQPFLAVLREPDFPERIKASELTSL